MTAEILILRSYPIPWGSRDLLLWWHVFISKLTAFISCSDVSHVIVVIDRTWLVEVSSSGLYAHDPGSWYAAHGERVRSAYSYTVHGAEGLRWVAWYAQNHGGKHPNPWKYEWIRLWHIITRGVVPCMTCLWPARCIMESVGVDVPQWVVAPSQLRRLLDASRPIVHKDRTPRAAGKGFG